MTDQELIVDLQYTLLEPPDGATFPSGLWTPAEVLAAMNRRQDLLLKLAAIEVGIATLPVAVGITQIALPDDWLITWNVVWMGADGTVRELIRSDQFQTDHAQPRWTATAGATPEVYFDHDQPLLQIQIAPAATVAGNLALLYIPQGATLDGTGELLTVPDEWATGVKYGTLTDLWGKDGRGRSPDRAAYCEQRFQFAIEIAQMVLRSSWVGP
jgi:hypothetical protein